jgi:hypothetical protein
MCQSGRGANEIGSANCIACGIAKFSNVSATEGTCEQCKTGQYQDKEEQTDCKYCPHGYYGQHNVSECKDHGWKKPDDCDESGELLDDSIVDPKNWTCVPCPPGVVCQKHSTVKNLHSFTANEQYWRVSDKYGAESLELRKMFLKCVFPQRCLAEPVVDLERRRLSTHNESLCTDGTDPTYPMCAGTCCVVH